MVIAQKRKALAVLKMNLLIFVLMLGIFAPFVQAKAATTDIYSYITELSVNDTTWKYGEPMQRVTVGHQEPVSVRYTLYFTKTQWEELLSDGKVNLNWELPSGVDITHVEQDVIATVDNKDQAIGTMEVVESAVQILVKEDYAELISYNDNIEITMGVTMQFKEGVHDLGEMIKIEASEAGHASALWNNYVVRINKIAEENDAKLLDGAYFEIDEYQYSTDANAYKSSMVFSLPNNHVEANGTYVAEGNGFITIEDKTAVLEGGFEPGNLYVLREVKAPIGYLPSAETVKFAFYRYTESDKQGTVNKIKELNAEYKVRYENEGGVAAFGSEMGVLDTQQHNVYVKNKKAPKLQVMKFDAMSGAVIPNVTFTLQIDAQKASYTVDQYKNLANAGWDYDASTGMIFWTMKTDENGLVSYPEGSIPYSAADYVLVEQVPKGYEGYGGTKTVSFKMNPNGSVEVTGGSAAVDAVNGIITIKVENKRTADIEILKVDEAGNTLEGAVFALYGPQQRNTEDVLEKDGKQYYYMGEQTTGADGKVVFSGLAYGKYYLVEKQAPEGYKILEDSYLVELNADTIEESICSVKIINTKKGPQIVETGGKGIGPYIAGGAVLLVLGSVFFLAAQKKKRKKAKRRAQAARKKSGSQTRNGRK